mgnify:CR=1 FL=1
MPMSERSVIIENLKVVDRVFSFNDFDGGASDAIVKAFKYGAKNIIFANGGDRTKNNIPEMWVWDDNPNIEFVFGVGGKKKKNSSSWILEKWKNPKTKRQWGWYRVLDDKPGYKPATRLVMTAQQHEYPYHDGNGHHHPCRDHHHHRMAIP